MPCPSKKHSKKCIGSHRRCNAISVDIYHSGPIRPAQRNGKGDALVEAVISALVASVIMAAVFGMYANVQHTANLAEGQLYAAALAQEAVDNLRAQPYSTLTANLGTHAPVVQGAPGKANGNANGNAGGINDPLFPRPLLIDTTLDYTGHADPHVSKGKHKGFQAVDPNTGAITNSINVVLSQTTAGNTSRVNVDVTIGWLDSTGKPRKHELKSIITPDGLNG